jgi:uncharacterized membrane protein YedE/YeeE
MDAFSYLSIVPSIIIALGITRLLTGIGRILENRDWVKVYSVHLLWALNVLLFMVLNWWVLFRWETQQEWTFFSDFISRSVSKEDGFQTKLL